MSHSLEITLRNEDGYRLTLFRAAPIRSTALENALRETTRVAIDADPEHSRYAPWTVISSKWER